MPIVKQPTDAFDMTPPAMQLGDVYVRSEIDTAEDRVVHFATNTNGAVVKYTCTKAGNFLMREEKFAIYAGKGNGLTTPQMRRSRSVELRGLGINPQGSTFGEWSDKNITLGDTQDHVRQVVSVVRQAVVGTMGPNGKLVVIQNGVSSTVTKDGVTVARSIEFTDKVQEMIGRIMTEAAIKTDDECGDGTTTTTLLTADLYGIFSDHPSYREQAFIERVIQRVIHHLGEDTIKVKNDSPELYNLALTSSNNDEKLSRLITDIYKASGDHFPEIEFREANGNTDIVQRTAGLALKMEYSSPGFSPNSQGERWLLDRAFVPIIVDEIIRSNSPQQTVQFVDKLYTKLIEMAVPVGTPVMIIARGIENAVNSVFMSINNSPEMVKYPIIGMQTNFGGSVGTALMGDVATIFGAPMVSLLNDALISNLTVCNHPVELGTQRSLVLSVDEATQERIAERVKGIRGQLDTQEMAERHSPRARYNEERIRSLSGQLVTVLVGGETHSEVKERKDRFVDVSKAVKSALVNGILPGVGSAFLKAVHEGVTDVAHELDKELNGAEWAPHQGTILNKILDLGFSPMAVLMGEDFVNGAGTIPEFLEQLKVTDLVTGKEGRPEELGIYDTAYASITALKGGLQTAKILANLSGALLGGKLSAVKFQG